MAGITSRSIDDLTKPAAQACTQFVSMCAARGVDVLVYCTYRDEAAQAALYAQGRTARGHIVTWAKPGESAHQQRRAWDCVPLRGGKPQWDASVPEWQIMGDVARALGIAWAGKWPAKVRELCHFEVKP